jgi:hypothetical protein
VFSNWKLIVSIFQKMQTQITKKEFDSYKAILEGNIYNMYSMQARLATGLEELQYWELIRNFSYWCQYYEAVPEAEKFVSGMLNEQSYPCIDFLMDQISHVDPRKWESIAAQEPNNNNKTKWELCDLQKSGDRHQQVPLTEKIIEKELNELLQRLSEEEDIVDIEGLDDDEDKLSPSNSPLVSLHCDENLDSEDNCMRSKSNSKRCGITRKSLRRPKNKDNDEYIPNEYVRYDKKGGRKCNTKPRRSRRKSRKTDFLISKML